MSLLNYRVPFLIKLPSRVCFSLCHCSVPMPEERRNIGFNYPFLLVLFFVRIWRPSATQGSCRPLTPVPGTGPWTSGPSAIPLCISLNSTISLDVALCLLICTLTFLITIFFQRNGLVIVSDNGLCLSEYQLRLQRIDGDLDRFLLFTLSRLGSITLTFPCI